MSELFLLLSAVPDFVWGICIGVLSTYFSMRVRIRYQTRSQSEGNLREALSRYYFRTNTLKHFRILFPTNVEELPDYQKVHLKNLLEMISKSVEEVFVTRWQARHIDTKWLVEPIRKISAALFFGFSDKSFKGMDQALCRIADYLGVTHQCHSPTILTWHDHEGNQRKRTDGLWSKDPISVAAIDV